MSKNPEKLSKLTFDKSEKTNINDIMKSTFTFEFLGLKAKEAQPTPADEYVSSLVQHIGNITLLSTKAHPPPKCNRVHPKLSQSKII
jgi:hypothetical protein